MKTILLFLVFNVILVVELICSSLTHKQNFDTIFICFYLILIYKLWLQYWPVQMVYLGFKTKNYLNIVQEVWFTSLEAFL